MGITPRDLATIPHQAKFVLPAFMDAVRGARARALGLVVASALCASPAWSADRVVKSNRAQADYFQIRCDDPAVFAQIAAEYHGAVIRARETIRPYWPPDMPRRFCEGIVTPPDGTERLSFYPPNYPIYYAIIANGQGYELKWCVVGLDRAWPVDRRCLLARP
jgi:hypothetical protein